MKSTLVFFALESGSPVSGKEVVPDLICVGKSDEWGLSDFSGLVWGKEEVMDQWP